MFRSILVAAVTAAFAASTTPSFAENDNADIKCDTASLGMMNDNVKGMVDPKLKDAVDSATKHLLNATAMMKASKMDECVAEMGLAKKDMMTSK